MSFTLFWPAASAAYETSKNTTTSRNISFLDYAEDGYVIGWETNDTVICIPGIIPLEEASTSNNVNSILTTIQKLHPCCYSEDVPSPSCCSCFPCACYGKLQIVAIWRSSSSNGKNTTSMSHVVVPVLSMTTTNVGPWWQYPNNGRKGQVIAYKPCGGIGTLGHYKSDFYDYGWDSTPFVASSFQTTLCRISEAEAIQQEILKHLNYHPCPSTSCNYPRSRSNQNIISSLDPTSSTSFFTFLSLFVPNNIWLPLFFSKSKWLFSFLESTSFIYTHFYNNNRKTPNHRTKLQPPTVMTLSRAQQCQYYLFSNDNPMCQSYQVKFDWWLGIVISISIVAARVLWMMKHHTPQSTSSSQDLLLVSVVVPTHLQWLEASPIGFKLNVPLTKQMSKAILWTLDFYHLNFLHYCWYFMTADATIFFLLLFFLGNGGGATTILAVFLDILQLSTIHICLVSLVVQYTYHHLLLLLRSLFLLVAKGKKRNILRGRHDTMEYDFMQLLLGTMFFSCTIFLVPTIFVYYVYTTLLLDLFLHTILLSIGCSLYVGICNCPVANIVQYFKYNHNPSTRILFDTDVFFAPLQYQQQQQQLERTKIQNNVTAYSLESFRTKGLCSILSDAYMTNIKSIGAILGSRFINIVLVRRRVSVVSGLIAMISSLRQTRGNSNTGNQQRQFIKAK